MMTLRHGIEIDVVLEHCRGCRLCEDVERMRTGDQLERHVVDKVPALAEVLRDVGDLLTSECREVATRGFHDVGPPGDTQLRQPCEPGTFERRLVCMVGSVVRCVVGPDRHATRVRRGECHRMHHLLLGEPQDETRRDDGALNGGDSAVEAPVHPSGREGEIETAADLVAEDDRLENLVGGHRHRVASQILPSGEGRGRGGSAEVPDEKKARVVHPRCVAAGVVHAGRGCRGHLGPVEP